MSSVPGRPFSRWLLGCGRCKGGNKGGMEGQVRNELGLVLSVGFSEVRSEREIKWDLLLSTARGLHEEVYP